MLSIFADIATIELSNLGWILVEANLPDAIIRSSCAMVFLAIGMRSGLFLGHSLFRYRANVMWEQAASAASYSAQRISWVYVAFLPVSVLVGIVGQAVPGLQQSAHVFGLLKFALIYMLAANVFVTGRDTHLLILVIVAEIVLGSTGAWASYKEGFFVVLIALAGSPRRFSIHQLGIALAGIAVMIYLSLSWTAVKMEYRASVVGGDTWTSLTWLAGKYFGGEINYVAAATDLLERVGYNKFYAMVMEANTESIQGIYLRAFTHIITPRIFFPDKAVLDDSAETAKVLGWSIDGNTSIGLGYVAQAHIDFGFPGLLFPMIVLGAIVGTIYAYFLTRPAPLLLREAFAVACLFSSLAFAGNIDKQFGGLIMTLLVLACVLRYGAPTFDRWLQDGRHLTRRRPHRSV
jgi:hypothetical protein